MSAPKIVVTGCGRAGTQYAAQLLGNLGVPCSHEKVYVHDLDPTDPDPAKVERRWVADAEASWLAAPFLAFHGVPKDAVIWHQLRDPLKVIRCWHSHRILSDFNHVQPPPAAVQEFVFRHLPECSKGDDLERCVKYVLGWTRMLLKLTGANVLRYRVEKLTPRSLRSLLFCSGRELSLNQVETGMGQVVGRVGACALPHVPALSASRVVKVPGGQELLELYHGLGYSFNLSEAAA